MSEIVEIVMDDRESNKVKEIANLLTQEGQFSHFDLKIERLEIGDMICRKTKLGNVCVDFKEKEEFIKEVIDLVNVCIEFKRGADYVKTIMDKRYHNQTLDMVENFDLSIFILNGTNEYVKSTEFGIDAYLASLGALGSKYRCSVYQVDNEYEAVVLAFSIFKHSNLKPNLKPVLKSNVSYEDRQIAAFSCIKGIGKGLAERILKQWSIKEIANIENPKIFMDNIKGLGKAKAQNIVNFFNGIY